MSISMTGLLLGADALAPTTRRVTGFLPKAATLAAHALETEKPMIQPPTLPAALPAPAPQAASAPDARALRQSAEAFEAVFLAEMLKAAGLGQPRQGFGGGGAGEDVFASRFADLHARALVARGGIGLADRIEAALLARGPGGRA
jgi:peptidoglycan hydrolase FlgJ